MSLTKPSLASVVRKQFLFKLDAYSGMFSTLVILQLIAIFFGSLGVVGGVGVGSYSMDVNITYYSADTVIAFTILWAFIDAILIKTKAYREDDFVFVTNRLSSNLSNIVFLFVASVIGAVTALLSKFLIRVIVYFFLDDQSAIQTGLVENVAEFLTGIAATILFIFMFASLGYFIGSLVQLHKSLAVIIPVVFIGVTILVEVRLPKEIGAFYFSEPSFLVFVCKAVVTLVLLFLASILISNRLEVRR